jgi:hypothetical protein
MLDCLFGCFNDQKKKKLTDTDFKSWVFQDWVLKNSILGRLVILDDIGLMIEVNQSTSESKIVVISLAE